MNHHEVDYPQSMYIHMCIHIICTKYYIYSALLILAGYYLVVRFGYPAVVVSVLLCCCGGPLSFDFFSVICFPCLFVLHHLILRTPYLDEEDMHAHQVQVNKVSRESLLLLLLLLHTDALENDIISCERYHHHAVGSSAAAAAAV